MIKQAHQLFLLLLLCSVSTMAEAQSDSPLPSWKEGKTKQAIIDFVGRVTDENSPDYVKPADRIATFDNDGTLWSEQPMYFQLFFALDRIKELAPQHPEWKYKQPFKGVLEGDLKAVLAGGKKSLLEIVAVTHSGMTTQEFEEIVSKWIATAKHPQKGKLFKDMVYQPMLELLTFLRANGFKTFIVSGGGIEFMRPWTKATYGIPPEQVVGSSIRTQYKIENGNPVLIRMPEINFIDDEKGKPVGINEHIGRIPIFAAGNSDGDKQMLEWTTIRRKPGFALIVHHTDAEREWAYDRDSHIGKLDKALNEAQERGWTVVDMKNDWSQIYPSSEKE